jgi:pimeloyl-ACP methyl ester carboxylesterase
MTQGDVGDTGLPVRFAGLGADLAGHADGRPPLVLLHGLSFDRTMWRPALIELERIDPGRQTLLLDLPGHGGSDASPSYGIEDVADSIHRAITEAGLSSPVVVGHSLAAIVATVYASRYTTSGVVNVDQSLRTQQFSEFLRSMAEPLHGPAFPAIWQGFLASMHIELLPAEAQELLRSTSTPRQDLVLGYWQEVLTRTPEELGAMAEAGQAILRSRAVPYLIVAGDDVVADYRDWLAERIPQAVVHVLSGSGHFPQLAQPSSFAGYLAETGHWPVVPEPAG